MLYVIISAVAVAASLTAVAILVSVVNNKQAAFVVVKHSFERYVAVTDNSGKMKGKDIARHLDIYDFGAKKLARATAAVKSAESILSVAGAALLVSIAALAISALGAVITQL